MMIEKYLNKKIATISIAIGLLLAVILTGRFSSFALLANDVRNDTLRLHVQANSDSAADQALKLQVRDAVLIDAAQLFGNEADKTAAVEKAQGALDVFQKTAERVVAEAGSSQTVKVYLTNMYFDTTYYDSFTLPAGRYDALRIELGDHAGKNWFCVLYPALCLPAAEGAAVYPTVAEQDLVAEDGFEIRFAALEWWQRATGNAEKANEALPAARLR